MEVRQDSSKIPSEVGERGKGNGIQSIGLSFTPYPLPFPLTSLIMQDAGLTRSNLKSEPITAWFAIVPRFVTCGVIDE